jgi:hypothetical protein
VIHGETAGVQRAVKVAKRWNAARACSFCCLLPGALILLFLGRIDILTGLTVLLVAVLFAVWACHGQKSAFVDLLELYDISPTDALQIFAAEYGLRLGRVKQDASESAAFLENLAQASIRVRSCFFASMPLVGAFAWGEKLPPYLWFLVVPLALAVAYLFVQEHYRHKSAFIALLMSHGLSNADALLILDAQDTE